MGDQAETLSKLPRRISVAEGQGWSLSEYRCTAGPADRPFEEAHEGVSLSLVTAGTFDYRTASGCAVLYPGAFLLGNAGECFECGHSHSVGDTCLALHLSGEHFAEIAAAIAGSSQFRFKSPMLPAHPALTQAAVSLQELGRAAAGEADAAVYGLMEAAVALLSGASAELLRLRPVDSKRISRVLRHLQREEAGTDDLAELASIASMSKYHFLRTFRRLAGTTPHQYLLAMRLRRAALKLARTREPIAELALASGFDDVSTFNRYFRRTFKLTPSAYRIKYFRSAL